MATIKQCKMLAARSSQAGMEYDFEAFKPLENGEVDDKLAEIEKFAQDGRTVGSKVEVKQQSEYNGQRAGMVYKLVCERVSEKWREAHPLLFVEMCVAEYQLAIQVEEAIKASSSSVINLCGSCPGKEEIDCEGCTSSSSKTHNLSNDELIEHFNTESAIENGSIKLVCDYCGKVTESVHLLDNNNTFVCGKCAWFNRQDWKSDSGYNEITDKSYIKAALKKRLGVA